MYATIQSWQEAVSLHASGHYQQAVVCYLQTADDISARFIYNMACAHIRLGDLHAAKQCLSDAVKRDRNLAVAFFQRGTINLDLKLNKEALHDFEVARMLLRGNPYINYRPLGLIATLHISQIFFNTALAVRLVNSTGEAAVCENLTGEVLFYLMEALRDVDDAADIVRTRIETAIRVTKDGDDITKLLPMKLDADRLFHPPKYIIRNMPHRSQKGSDISKVVFSSNEDDTSPGFKGQKRIPELELRRSVSLRKRSTIQIDLKFQRSRSYSGTEFRQKLKKKMNHNPQIKQSASHEVEGDVDETDDLNPSNVPFKRRHAFRRTFSRIRRSKNTKSDSVLVKEQSAMETATRSLGSLDDFKKSVDKSENVKTVTDAERGETDNSDCIHINSYKNEALKPRKSILKNNATHNEKVGNTEGTMTTSVSASAMLPGVTFTRSLSTRLPKRQAKSLTDLKPSKSSILPLDAKDSSSLTTLKRRLSKLRIKNKEKAKAYPSFVMQGFSNVNNLAALMTIPYLSDEAHTPRNDLVTNHLNEHSKSTSKDDKRAKTSTNKRTSVRSLGTVCCDRSTVVKYALSTALDVATAFVTPLVDESEEANLRQVKITRKQNRDMTIKEPVRVTRGAIKSTKTNRAPEPPRISDPLFAMADLLAAFAKGKPVETSTDPANNNHQPADGDADIEITELNGASWNDDRTYYSVNSFFDSEHEMDDPNFVTAMDGFVDDNHNIVDYVNVKPKHRMVSSNDEHSYENCVPKPKPCSGLSTSSTGIHRDNIHIKNSPPSYTPPKLTETLRTQSIPCAKHIFRTYSTRHANELEEKDIDVHSNSQPHLLFQKNDLQHERKLNSAAGMSASNEDCMNPKLQKAAQSTRAPPSYPPPPPPPLLLSKKPNYLGYILGQSLNIAVGVVGNHKYDDHEDNESIYKSCLGEIVEEQDIDDLEGKCDSTIDVSNDFFGLRKMETRRCVETSECSCDCLKVDHSSATERQLREKAHEIDANNNSENFVLF